jgi:hypothetical protein
MPQMITPTMDRKQAFDAWFEALRSGDYTQATGALCRVDDEGNSSYCCVGVLDEVVFKTSWTPGIKTEYDTVMVDQFGEEGNLSEDIVAPLGLDQCLTVDECDTLAAYGVGMDTDDTRIAALAMLNDNGADYDTIVMLMEEFGWEND